MNNFIKDIKLILINKKLIGIMTVMMIMVCTLICTHHYMEKDTVSNKKKFNIGVINEDSSKYANLLIDFFKSNDSFSCLANVVEGESSHIKSELQAGNLDAYIVIPHKFVSSLRYLEPVGIEVVLKTQSETETVVLKSILKSYERYVLAVQLNASGLYDICDESGMDEEENSKLNMLITWNLINMTLGKEDYFKYIEIKTENIGLINHYVFVFIFLALVYVGIYAGIIVKREQQSKVLDLYVVNGASKVSYVLSKALCIASIFTICVGICTIIGSMAGVLHMNFQLLLIIFLSSLIINIIMICFSLKIRSINVYALLFNVSTLLVVIIGGGIIPAAYMPDNMAKIANYMPYCYFEEMISRYMKF